VDSIEKAVDCLVNTLPHLTVLHDEPMCKHTTLGIGGPVQAMVFPETESCMIQVFKALQEHDIRPFVMGKGSNLLVSDKHMNMVVINTTKLRNIELTDAVSIRADSGVMLSELAVFAHKHELTGLEFAHGIPGTLGGAVFMNAGAYGSEMKDVIYSTRAYNYKNGEYTLTEAQHEFSYRNSIFASTKDVVLSSIIQLKKGDTETIKDKMKKLAAKRCESQPLDRKSAGSTFKRPKEGYAAALIEQAGLKGFSIGGAQVSSMHAGFVINAGNATFDDFLAVMEHIQETVLKNSGIMLEPEVKVLVQQ